MRLTPRAMRTTAVFATALLFTPLLAEAQSHESGDPPTPPGPVAPVGPIANDFAFFYRHDVRTGCTDFRCQDRFTGGGGRVFTDSDLPGGDTGTQLVTNGATSSGGRAGFSGSGTSFLPALSVYSFTEPTTRVQNWFAGVHRYTVGDGVTSLTLNSELSFTSAGVPSFFNIDNPGADERDDMDPQGLVITGMFVWEADYDQLGFGNCSAFAANEDSGAICFSGGSSLNWPGVRRLGDATFDNFGATGGLTSGTLTVSGLTPGQQIFVGGWVTTVSGFGGFVDARNTVRLSFSEPDVASPAVQTETFAPAELPPSVPEPATWTLLGLGLAGMTVRRCGRR